MTLKRKAEQLNMPQVKKPRPRLNPIRQYEQDKILLENFVKYGILSDKVQVNREMSHIPLPMSPISPIHGPMRHYKNPEPFVRGVFKNSASTPKPFFLEQKATKEMNMKPIAKTPCALWRPWVESKTKVVRQFKQPVPKQIMKHADDVHVVPNQINTVKKVPRKPFTPQVINWDTTSPEFFNSFKHPVK